MEHCKTLASFGDGLPHRLGSWSKTKEHSEMNEINKALSKLDERLARIEDLLSKPSNGKEFRKDWFTVPEAAEMLEKQPYTIREWCRLGRIEAKKRECGRGRTSEWVISVDAIERYLNDGLSPLDF